MFVRSPLFLLGCIKKHNIRNNKKGRGKIQIEFYSESDFQRLLDIISES